MCAADMSLHGGNEQLGAPPPPPPPINQPTALFVSLIRVCRFTLGPMIRFYGHSTSTVTFVSGPPIETFLIQMHTNLFDILFFFFTRPLPFSKRCMWRGEQQICTGARVLQSCLLIIWNVTAIAVHSVDTMIILCLYLSIFSLWCYCLSNISN